MTFGDLTIEPAWVWLTLAALLGIAEILVPGLFLIWLAAAAALTGFGALLFGPPLAFQLGLFGLIAIAAVLIGRRWYADHPVPSEDPLLNDRVARLLGQTVEVVEPIRNGSGRVRVGDGVWPARGADAPAGATVRVTGAQGACLTVEPTAIPHSPNIG